MRSNQIMVDDLVSVHYSASHPGRQYFTARVTRDEGQRLVLSPGADACEFSVTCVDGETWADPRGNAITVEAISRDEFLLHAQARNMTFALDALGW